jgi:hypothetical protein
VTRCRPLPRASELSSELASQEPHRRDIRFGFLFAAPEEDAPTWVCRTSSFADRKTDSQLVGFDVNGSHRALQNCMPLIPKTKEDSESGSMISSNSFILNNMAARMGFEFS